MFSQTPFHITSSTSRSRILSSLNKESVEAPKNYVDYDDEPGKLKDMLKGKPTSSKDRDASDTSSTHSSPGAQVKDSPPRRKREDARSLLSATNTPTMNHKSPLPSSGNSQPPPNSVAAAAATPSSEMRLFCHIVAPKSGGTITGLQAVDDIFIALHNNGQLVAFSSQDGRCLLKTHPQDSALRPPAGVFDHRGLANADRTYNRLESLVVGEFTLLFALAGLDGESQNSLVSEAGGASPGDWTRVSVYEYRRPHIDGLMNARAKLVGDWHVNSAIDNIWIGLPSEANTFSLFYIQHESSELICQNLLVSSKPVEFPSQQYHDAPAHHHHAPLSNPFKMMGGKGEEAHPVQEDPRALGKVALVEEVATGVAFPPMDRIHGLSFFVSSDGSMDGTVWSSSGFLSFQYLPSQRKGTSVCTSILRRIRKIQQSGPKVVTVLLKDRLERYEVGLSEDQQEGTVSHYCHTLKSSVPLKGASNYLQRSSCFSLQIGSASPHLDLIRLSEMKMSTLWRCTEANVKRVRRSALLPLDFDHILLGSGDGKLRKSSFASLIGSASPQPPPKSDSEHSLNGYIISLQKIENPRTKEDYVVGGADDGSIAIWSANSLGGVQHSSQHSTGMLRVGRAVRPTAGLYPVHIDRRCHRSHCG